uniref:Lipoprotein n=1 Tax=Cacopsylla melanoneura TaxID=428564 RepID=A0A8D8TSE5_9HEMI
MLPRVIKLLLAFLSLTIFSCESDSFINGSSWSRALSGLPDLCLNGNTTTCDSFCLNQAKLVCKDAVYGRLYSAQHILYNKIKSRTCLGQTCRVQLGTTKNYIYANLDCFGNGSATWINCKCAAFLIDNEEEY